jgi:hypothetical protein
MQQNPSPPGLIDNLGDGYRVIHRRPLLVLLPIIINLYLWFGTRISFAPLFGNLSSFLERAQPAEAPADPAAFDALAEIGQIDMRQPLAILNSIPTLPITQVVNAEQVNQVIEVHSVWFALLIFLAINVVALPLTAIFLRSMAMVVRGEQQPLVGLLQQSARAGLSILAVALIFGGVGAALMLPFLLFAGILVTLNQAIGTFAIVLMSLVVFWVQIYLGFANEAIVIGNLNPLRALHASFNIVRQNFWSTIGLLFLSLLISMGSAVIWRTMIGSTVGLVAAIIGSAYLGCGLQAARMVFFQERLQRWQKLPKRA